MDITVERLKELLSYDPETGRFVWLKRTSNRIQVGDIAGTPHGVDRRYVRINIDAQYYLAHRLAWFYTHGKWPAACIDHINRNGQDNRIVNLREATHAQNLANQPLGKRNNSGIKNVSWYGRKRVWRVQITKGGKNYQWPFKTREEAVAAVDQLRKQMHGEFATDGLDRRAA